MINSQDNIVYKKVNLEQIIYQYLRDYVENHTPNEVVAEFRRIFFEFSIQDALLRSRIEKLIFSKEGQGRFCYILNYCYHIVINHWAQQAELQDSIIKLVDVIDLINFKAPSYDRRRKKILELSGSFRRTDYYVKLKRIANVVTCNPQLEFDPKKIIFNYLTHYPYLYQPLLLGKEYIPEEKNLIIKLQSSRQEHFEFQLAQHIIYRSRLKQVAQARQISHGAGKLIRRVKNPSLLSEQDIKNSLKKYLEKPNGKETIYQISQKFLAKNQLGISYKEFKKNLNSYLILGIKSRNKEYQFNKLISKILDKSYSQSDAELLNDSLIFQTCRRLLRFLVVDQTQQNNHRRLIDLVMNLGTASTVSLLIRIILICPKIKPELEEKLAILFVNYDSKNAEDVTWLIKILENFLIAFGLYFGKIDLSATKII